MKNSQRIIFLHYLCGKIYAIKTLKRLTSGMLWLLLGITVSLFVLLHIPAVQRCLGTQVSGVLSERLGTHVSVGKVGIMLPNRIIVDDVEICDQSGKPMLSSSRLSAKCDLLPLSRGRISISSAQLFGLDARLYKASADAPANYQFVLDSLSSGEHERESRLDLNINSLIVRNGHVGYDRLDIPTTPGRLSPHHLDLSNLSGHLMLYRLTDEQINLRVKKLSMHEASGLELKRLAFDLEADRRHALLKGLTLEGKDTHVDIDSIKANYHWDGKRLDPQSLTYEMSLAPSRLTPSDFTPLLPALREFTSPLSIEAAARGTYDDLDVTHLSIHSEGDALRLTAQGSLHDMHADRSWMTHIQEFTLRSDGMEQLARHFGDVFHIPPQLSHLGDVHYRGDAGGAGHSVAMSGTLDTDAGSARLLMSLTDRHFSGQVDTEELQLGRILQVDDLGRLSTSVVIDGQLPISPSMRLAAKGHVALIEYAGRSYENIQVDGTYDSQSFRGLLRMDAPDGQIAVDGQFDLSQSHPSADLVASVRHFSPSAFGLSTLPVDGAIDTDATVKLTGSHINDLEGSLSVTDLRISQADGTLALDHLSLDIANQSGERSLRLDSDFGHVAIEGNIGDYRDLLGSALGMIHDKLPSLPIPHPTPSHSDNRFTVDATLTDSQWLRQVLGIPLSIDRPITFAGRVDDSHDTIDMELQAESFGYGDHQFRNAGLTLHTVGDTLVCQASAQKAQEKNLPIDLSLIAKAAADQLLSTLTFDNHGTKASLRGTLSSQVELGTTSHGGMATTIHILPSQVLLNDTAWQVRPAVIKVSDREVALDHLSIGNGRQHITLDGTATDKPGDAIDVELQDIDFAYLSDIVDVSGVDFSGRISGDARLTSLFGSPEATAHLDIDDFRFVDGRIGDMSLRLDWDSSTNKLMLDGLADDEGNTTSVGGDITLSPLELNLLIDSDGTPLEFIERYCGSFLHDVDARLHGHLHIFGPSSNINIEGQMTADGNVTLPALNTTYTLLHSKITLVPDHIKFVADTIADRHGHLGIVNGEVSHAHLTNFGYDLQVHASDLLAYDFKEMGDQTFCGTVYADGDCHIYSSSGGTTLDIDVTPTRNTVFYYNAASPDALNGQDFIQWNDVSPTVSTLFDEGIRSVSDDTQAEERSKTPDIPSDLRMNFRINATPDATLRLLMDANSGDYIALNGTGALRATYFNKGSFNIYGNYAVDHGIYKLTVQNILRKDFIFQPGGSITFVGNPYDATLSLKATYTVNGVPLSDLNLGRSFTSNNIRVDCVMNITGTANQPSVDFDMEMPTVSNDAQQMVHHLINSEEELNQQVIYLLAIGRFYNQTNNTMDQDRQSQASLAMQSLLSGTISQQINSLLGNFVNNSNWNFGANISTGDEGWNNAEYEGLLSGRLLDNRLQFNGQFGYRDNPNATTSFIGDFDIRYLLLPNGNLAVKVYNQTNDRYFIKNSLNTQGVGLIMKKDFNGWRDLLGIHRKKEDNEQPNHKK